MLFCCCCWSGSYGSFFLLCCCTIFSFSLSLCFIHFSERTFKFRQSLFNSLLLFFFFYIILRGLYVVWNPYTKRTLIEKELIRKVSLICLMASHQYNRFLLIPAKKDSSSRFNRSNDQID